MFGYVLFFFSFFFELKAFYPPFQQKKLPFCPSTKGALVLPCFQQTNGLCDTGRLGNSILALMGASLYVKKACHRELVVPQLRSLKKFFTLEGGVSIREDLQLLRLKEMSYVWEWLGVGNDLFWRDRVFQYLSYDDRSHPPLGYDDPHYFSFFFHHTSLFAAHHLFYRCFFAWRGNLLSTLLKVEAILKEESRQGPFLTIHVRRGDLSEAQDRLPTYFVTPVGWYLSEIKRQFQELQKPFTLYLASDSLNSVRSVFEELPEVKKVLTFEDLERRAPIGPSSLTPEERALFYDFVVFSSDEPLFFPYRKRLMISNSTLSLSGAFLSSGGLFYRPHPQQQQFVPFNPWSTEPLLTRENLEVFPD